MKTRSNRDGVDRKDSHNGPDTYAQAQEGIQETGANSICIYGFQGFRAARDTLMLRVPGSRL